MLAPLIALAPPAPVCVDTAPVALQLDGDGGDTRTLLEKTLPRACLDPIAGPAEWTVRAVVKVTDAGYAITLEAVDAAGKSAGRVSREATSPLAAPPRDDIVAGALKDALGVLRTKMGLAPPTRACREHADIVVLWHKDTSMGARDEAKRALLARCVRVKEEVEASRRNGMDVASFLSLPLVAIKVVADDAGAVAVAADVIDPSAEQLTVKAHASEKGAETDVVLRRALDQVLPSL